MAFGNDLGEGDDIVSEINMVPMIDVMLVMLIIFIITVPVLSHTVQLELPRAESARRLLEPQRVQLSVTADGRLHWNDELLPESDLPARLRELASGTPPPEVVVRGDRNVPYERVVRVLAAVQQAGIAGLGIVTEPGR